MRELLNVCGEELGIFESCDSCLFGLKLSIHLLESGRCQCEYIGRELLNANEGGERQYIYGVSVSVGIS